MAGLHFLQVPRPKKFLYLMSLRSGAEVITLTVLINKVSGLYGILALLTGYQLGPLQLSMYIYSLFAFVLTLYLAPSIRNQQALQCVALACFYAVDSVINVLYTAAFAIAWFLVLASHPDNVGKIPGGGTINQTAGFTNPKYNASHVEVIPTPQSGIKAGQDAVTVGVAAGSNQPATLGDALFQSGSFTSITIICIVWIVRVYFALVMLAYARVVLRHHIITSSSPSASWQHSGTTQDGLAENPFAESKEEGHGWRGKLGRAMLSVAPRYWLGADEDGEWARGIGGRFNKKAATPIEPIGVLERERRRRSGTGPPEPSPQLPRLGAISPKPASE